MSGCGNVPTLVVWVDCGMPLSRSDVFPAPQVYFVACPQVCESLVPLRSMPHSCFTHRRSLLPLAVPVVDLLNHASSARPPMLQLDDDDRLVVTVLPTRGGEAAPMAVGDELLISYGERQPLDAWLKFGFVSEEYWELAEGEGH